ncbi:MAG: hypothetical protein JWM93_1475 [Frankiales bacterium]|nr:hypothetical protein [Frankiales bacterium]
MNSAASTPAQRDGYRAVDTFDATHIGPTNVSRETLARGEGTRFNRNGQPATRLRTINTAASTPGTVSAPEDRTGSK